MSSYFRDILKTTPCKHPIIILKDTGKEEASAMLEFAYTGEVNVAQELLPSLLHTAKAFRIKGLDKVESPIEQPPAAHQQRVETHDPPHWVGEAGSAHPSRSHTPSSIHSQQDVKPPPFFLGLDNKPVVQHAAAAAAGPHQAGPHRRDLSPPPSLPNSQPPTREGSPSRTPPPKRWKRSFDMTQPTALNGHKDTNGSNEEHRPLQTVIKLSSYQ